MKQKVIRAGRHSLAVVIPAAFTHAIGVKPGDDVMVDVSLDEGKVHIQFEGVTQMTLLETKKKRKKK